MATANRAAPCREPSKGLWQHFFQHCGFFSHFVITNRYPSSCHICGQPVPAGQGRLVRLSSGYKVQCADCAKNRMTYRPRMPGKKRWR